MKVLWASGCCCAWPLGLTISSLKVKGLWPKGSRISRTVSKTYSMHSLNGHNCDVICEMLDCSHRAILVFTMNEGLVGDGHFMLRTIEN